jgi:hypothetical protein
MCRFTVGYVRRIKGLVIAVASLCLGFNKRHCRWRARVLRGDIPPQGALSGKGWGRNSGAFRTGGGNSCRRQNVAWSSHLC